MNITKVQLTQIIKEEIAKVLKEGMIDSETEKIDPLASLDPELTKELVNAAIFRLRDGYEKEGDLRQHMQQFKDNLRYPWKHGGTAEPVALSTNQVKAIFLAALATLKKSAEKL